MSAIPPHTQIMLQPPTSFAPRGALTDCRNFMATAPECADSARPLIARPNHSPPWLARRV